MTWREKRKQEERARLQVKTKEQLIDEILTQQEEFKAFRGRALGTINRLGNTCGELHKEAEQYITSVLDDTCKTLEARKNELICGDTLQVFSAKL